MPVSWFYTADDEQARLQEIFYHLDANTRRPLLTQAVSLIAANPPSNSGASNGNTAQPTTTN
jgi:hypothetical protein